MNKEVKERIKSIIYTLVFLIGMTWFWYGPRQNINLLAADMNRSLIHNDAELISNGEILLDQSELDFQLKNTKNEEINYEIIIDNNARKSTDKMCQIMSNNYLSYQLKYDEEYDIVRNLPVNGVIYRGVLKPNEQKGYSLKMTTVDGYQEYSKCVSPMIRVATYDKV